MELTYESFQGLNIEDEIEKIKRADVVNIKVSTTDKAQLFLLGMLFAANKKINIINKEELDILNRIEEDLKKYGKSYVVMAYVWEKLTDENFPKKDFSDVVSDLDKLIENVKRLNLAPIVNSPIENKFFLICPVRDALEKQIEEMTMYVYKKRDEGFIAHAPFLGDTAQFDRLGGYVICVQKATGMATSSEIQIYYDQTSKGTMFDLGVAYYLEKPLTIINEDKIKYDEVDFGDSIVMNWYKRDKAIQRTLN